MSKFLDEFAHNDIKDSYNKGGLFGKDLLVFPCENRAVSWQGYDRRAKTPDLTRYTAEYNY